MIEMIIVEAALYDHWELRAVDSVEMYLATDKISRRRQNL